jgi:hypothetical protein
MDRSPRASLTIDILTDQDFATLMREKDGPAAFGVFVALLVAGRERYFRGRARHLSGSDSLVFDDRQSHILLLTHINKGALKRAVELMAEVANDTGSDPWLYLTDAGQIVIRSFFKWNVQEGWGGRRPNAGRPKQNQLDSESGNQVDSKPIQDGAPPSPSPSPSSSLCSEEPPSPPTGGETVTIDPDHLEEVRVGQAIDRAMGSVSYGPALGRFRADYPLAWWERVFTQVVATMEPRPARPWPYALKILATWKAEGGPPTVPMHRNGKPAAAPLPPPKSPEEQARADRLRDEGLAHVRANEAKGAAEIPGYLEGVAANPDHPLHAVAVRRLSQRGTA